MNANISAEQLAVMLDSIKRDAEAYFSVGRVRLKKKLLNGAVVVVTITMPPTSEESGER